MKNDASCIFARKTVGVNVGKLREEKGLSQSELARRIQIDRSHINRLEGGKNNVTVDILVKIADELDVPLVALFDGLEKKAPGKLSQIC